MDEYQREKQVQESKAEWLHTWWERRSPHYETVPNCTEHLDSHHSSVHWGLSSAIHWGSVEADWSMQTKACRLPEQGEASCTTTKEGWHPSDVRRHPSCHVIECRWRLTACNIHSFICDETAERAPKVLTVHADTGWTSERYSPPGYDLFSFCFPPSLSTVSFSPFLLATQDAAWTSARCHGNQD